MSDRAKESHANLKARLGRDPTVRELANEMSIGYMAAYIHVRRKELPITRAAGASKSKDQKTPSAQVKARHELIRKNELRTIMKQGLDNMIDVWFEGLVMAAEEEMMAAADAMVKKLHATAIEMEKRAQQSLCVVCGDKQVIDSRKLICEKCTAARNMTGRDALKG